MCVLQGRRAPSVFGRLAICQYPRMLLERVRGSSTQSEHDES